jgi:hypothetical protein
MLYRSDKISSDPGSADSSGHFLEAAGDSYIYNMPKHRLFGRLKNFFEKIQIFLKKPLTNGW